MSDKLQSGIKAGSTSVSLAVLLKKTSDGTEQTGKIYSDITASYWRQGGSPVSITPVTLSAIDAAYSSGGFLEASASLAPGAYRFDPPDAAFSSGADWVIISVMCAGCFAFEVMFNLTSNVVQSGDAYTVVNSGTYGNSALKTLIDTITEYVNELETRLTAQRAANLDELGAANIPADIDSLLSRLSAVRAGYLDKLNIAGNVAATGEAANAVSGLNDISVADILSAAYGDGTLTLSDLLTILSAIFGGVMTTTLDDTNSGTITFFNQAAESVVTATFVNGGRTAVVWDKVS